MENLVSPLIKADHTVVDEKQLLDDSYAYVAKIDDLTRHEFYYISQKIEQGWITERDVELVKFVHVHRWVTLSQITRLFFPDVERDETVRKRINRLLKYGLIRRLQWSSYSRPKENKPSFYELGASGADILKFQYGTYLGHRDPRNPKPITMLFRMRYIATNELYIQLRESFELVHFEFHPTLVINEAQQVPTAKFVLRNPKGREMSFYLICHREDEKWVKTIRYQARFFKGYFATIDPEATLVVLVSSDEKANLASKIMEQEGAGPITWFVTDNDLYDPNIKLSKAFFAYQNGVKFYYDLQ
ncbi:replication-relaxation family protein [Paenibacillus sp. PL91]|uniref:replication-relaxation family protein n=1 Tax=Paenibacillus sp. PL91 TaxID=2729538 RepID=UPI00145E6980|nr:replication-relaxation family protein [Paenibacillus sp. PL91]MBC9204727.1 replication-relaxation family protein [Paenibacillus sp. PL91]